MAGFYVMAGKLGSAKNVAGQDISGWMQLKQTKAPDHSYVESATRAIVPDLRPGNLVNLESTSPVGTTELIYKIVVAQRPELEGKVHAAHCPVRVLPGPGVGGHCIAVDPWFIVSSAPKQARLIKAARKVHDTKPHWVIEKVKIKAARFKEPVIGCLGLTFKANIATIKDKVVIDTRGVLS